MNRCSVSLPKSPLNTRAFLRRALTCGPAALTLPLLVLNQSAQAANTEYDVVNGQTDLTNAAGTTYTTGGTPGTGAGGTPTATVPSVTSDVTFDSGVAYSPAAFTLNTSQTFGSLNDLSTTTITVANTGAAADTLTLGGAGDPGSSVPGSAAGDLFFVGTGANLTLTGGTGATALGLVLGQSGNFDVVGTAAISSIISDGGMGFGITKTGGGTLTLSGVNTFTGPTTITGGTLSIAADSGLGTAPTTATANQLTINGGTLAISANITLAANRGITLGANGATVNETNNSNVGIAGIITGPGALTVSNIGGARTLTLSGANTFSGGVIVLAGSQVTPTNATGLGTGTVTLGTTGSTSSAEFTLGGGINVANPVTVTAGGTRLLELNTGNSTSTESGAITLTAGTVNPTLNLANSNGNSTLNVTGGITGTGNVIFGTGLTSGRTNASITVSGGSVNNVGTITNQTASSTGSTMTISSVIGANVTGVTQNNATVPLVLSGANAYTGTTTVTAGTLFYNGSVGTTATPAGAVTVASGATLGGTGILTVASATVTGKVAPGATAGATTGALTLNTTSGLTINGTLGIGIAGAGSTSLATNGALTLGSASILTVTGTPTAADYTLATSGSAVSGVFSSSTVPTGYQVIYNDPAFETGGIAGDIELEAVPEPSTLWAGALMLGGAGWYYRRQVRTRRA